MNKKKIKKRKKIKKGKEKNIDKKTVAQCTYKYKSAGYKSGDDITIVSLNFSLRDALDMDVQLYAEEVRSDVFHVNFVPGMDMDPLVKSCAKTRKLIIVDDSKSVTKFSDVLVADLCKYGVTVKLLSFNRRGCSDEEYGANEDRYVPDFDKVLAFSREK